MPIVTVSGQWTYVLVREQATERLMWVRALQWEEAYLEYGKVLNQLDEGAEGELQEAADLMDKTGVWSSLPACSRVNEMTVGSGMVEKDDTTQTQVARPFVWESPLSSALGPHHLALGLVAASWL